MDITKDLADLDDAQVGTLGWLERWHDWEDQRWLDAFQGLDVAQPLAQDDSAEE